MQLFNPAIGSIRRFLYRQQQPSARMGSRYSCGSRIPCRFRYRSNCSLHRNLVCKRLCHCLRAVINTRRFPFCRLICTFFYRHLCILAFLFFLRFLRCYCTTRSRLFRTNFIFFFPTGTPLRLPPTRGTYPPAILLLHGSPVFPDRCSRAPASSDYRIHIRRASDRF